MNHVGAAHQATVQVTTVPNQTPKSSLASIRPLRSSISSDTQQRKQSAASSATSRSKQQQKRKQQVLRDARCYESAPKAAVISLALSSASLLLIELHFRTKTTTSMAGSVTSGSLTLVAGACLLHLVLLLLLALVNVGPLRELFLKNLIRNNGCDISANNSGDDQQQQRQRKRLWRAQCCEWALLVCSSAWSLAMALRRTQLVPLQLTTTLALYLLASFRARHRQLVLALVTSHALHLALYPFITPTSLNSVISKLDMNHHANNTLINSTSFLPRPAGDGKSDTATPASNLLVQMISIGLAYVVFHLVGVYLHRQREHQQAKSIEDIERFVRSRVELDTEDRKLTKMLESVIPRHLASKMRDDVLDPNAAPAGNFHKSYLDSFDNVSILFADIVNFTKISSNCTPKLLVETLNELFGRFDKAADRNNCLRIKILGDCYYCVSGIPARAPDEPHARQCVEMGLDMIDILDDLARDNNQVDLKMRVGIHTGRVLCGILGKKKWQFDVHSYDVKLANHLEQSGTPGRVHITGDTLAQLRMEEEAHSDEEKVYRVEPAHGHARDAYIAERNVATYFVFPPEGRRRHSYGSFNLSSVSASRVLGGQHKQQQQQQQQQQPAPSPASCDVEVQVTGAPPPPHAALAQQVVVVSSGRGDERAETTLVQNLASGQQVRTLDRLERLIGGSSSSASPREVVSEIDFGAMGRRAADPLNEEDEQEAPLLDLHPRRSGGAASQLNIPTNCTSTSGNGKETDESDSLVPRRASSSAVIGALAAGLPVAHSSTSLAASQQGALQVGKARFKKKARGLINVRYFIRTIEAPFTNLGHKEPTAAVNIDKMICDTIEERSLLRDVHKWTLRFKSSQLARRYSFSSSRHCYLTCLAKQSCALLAGFLTLLSLAYLCLFRSSKEVIDSKSTSQGDDDNNGESWTLLAQFTCLFLQISLVYMHQWELDARRDFIWHEKALADKGQMARMRDCNKSIFFNLLPPHVAVYFLERTHLRHMDLYYHSCETIGVIFANISNFSDFYQEIQGNDHGKGCLQVLNEILCEFDLLLDLPRYRAIDKIKTIGSTYMAAIGLCPNFELPSLASASESDVERAKLLCHLKTMLKFVYEMRECLNAINEHAYNSFKLRVGFNVGPVTAGVIGATKPQYDIWGNTVNVASRMESTCEPHSFIQVTEDVHSLLSGEPELKFTSMETWDKCELALRLTSTCRGEVDVKGKGKMTTYYLDFEPAAPSGAPPTIAETK